VKRPYTPGQALAWLDPHPDGIRLHRATVIHIEPTRWPDRWWITTDRGDATVDNTGHSGHVIPIDTDIAKELWERGDGYLIHPSFADHHRTVERDVHDLGLGTDQGDDIGLD